MVFAFTREDHCFLCNWRR